MRATKFENLADILYTVEVFVLVEDDEIVMRDGRETSLSEDIVLMFIEYGLALQYQKRFAPNREAMEPLAMSVGEVREHVGNEIEWFSVMRSEEDF